MGSQPDQNSGNTNKVLHNTNAGELAHIMLLSFHINVHTDRLRLHQLHLKGMKSQHNPQNSRECTFMCKSIQNPFNAPSYLCTSNGILLPQLSMQMIKFTK